MVGLLTPVRSVFGTPVLGTPARDALRAARPVHCLHAPGAAAVVQGNLAG